MDVHLEFRYHCHVINSEMAPQLSEDVAKDTEKPLAGCGVGGNRKNTPGEADEGWRFSASKAKVTVK